MKLIVVVAPIALVIIVIAAPIMQYCHYPYCIHSINLDTFSKLDFVDLAKT
jgi:hypothetical protein